MHRVLKTGGRTLILFPRLCGFGACRTIFQITESATRKNKSSKDWKKPDSKLNAQLMRIDVFRADSRRQNLDEIDRNQARIRKQRQCFRAQRRFRQTLRSRTILAQKFQFSVRRFDRDYGKQTMIEDFYCEQVLSGQTRVEIVLETENVLAFHHTRPFGKLTSSSFRKNMFHRFSRSKNLTKSFF